MRGSSRDIRREKFTSATRDASFAVYSSFLPCTTNHQIAIMHFHRLMLGGRRARAALRRSGFRAASTARGSRLAECARRGPTARALAFVFLTSTSTKAVIMVSALHGRTSANGGHLRGLRAAGMWPASAKTSPAVIGVHGIPAGVFYAARPKVGYYV